MTTDEELAHLEEGIRRLKVEYDVYFGGGSNKTPSDLEWRVRSLIKKFSDSQKLNVSQRFHYNTMVERYAIYSDLWRKKSRIREEGYRRPQDALLAVQGVRSSDEPAVTHRPVYGLSHAAAAAAGSSGAADSPLTVQCSDARAETDGVKKLYEALSEAKRKAGEPVSGNLESFTAFVQKKTDQIRKKHGCQSVEYTVEVQGGHVQLKAKAKE